RLKDIYIRFKSYFDLTIDEFDDKHKIVIEFLIDYKEDSLFSRKNKSMFLVDYITRYNKYLRDYYKNKEIVYLTLYERWDLQEKELLKIIKDLDNRFELNLKKEQW